MSLRAAASRDYVFTINNYTDADINVFDNLVSNNICKYVCYGKEIGEGGTPHLQGFLQLVKKNRLSYLKTNIHPTAYFEKRAGSVDQAKEYCQKDGIFVEFGDLSLQGFRTDLHSAALIIKEGGTVYDIAEAMPCTFIRNHRGLYAYSLAISSPYTHPQCRGYWFIGPPGVGKSYKARELFPNAYLKSQNKWFDGYTGQDTIILDDLDKGGACLSHHLKIWSDRYACTGETKGGTVLLQHKRIIITSNFTIPELFMECDQVTIDAIDRRFIVHTFNKEFTTSDSPVTTGEWITTISPPLLLTNNA